MASADLNETAMSLIDSPGMTGEEVVEQARKEYSLLKAKRLELCCLLYLSK